MKKEGEKHPYKDFAEMSDDEMESAHTKSNRTVVAVYAHLPKGVSIADLDNALNYYIRSSYWIGYAHALTHREVENAAHRDPRGRRTLRDAIANELSHNPEMPTLEICRKLDKLGLSARFTYQGKGLLVGSRYAPPTKWSDVYDEPCVKMVISRLRIRARREATARRWLRTGRTVFGGNARIDAIRNLSRM